jgi:hypothetical protein
MIRPAVLALAPVLALWQPALPQTHTMSQGVQRMELMLERLDGDRWDSIDPALVLAQGDRVRFRFRTNFDGYLYVMNQSSSGHYEQLFPREETGQDNRIAASRDYQVPATSTAFRIAGPPGHEIVYWLVTPARINGAPPQPAAPPGNQAAPIALTPRCDDAILHARGECVDDAAGPKLAPRGADLPRNLSAANAAAGSGLLFMRQKDTAVISSPEPLAGPVLYEFDLAHR